MSISDEQIIAFLLGNADQALVSRMNQQLPLDCELAERVSHFRSVLSHLDHSQQWFEPPSNLVENTLQRIDQTLVPLEDSQTIHGTSRMGKQMRAGIQNLTGQASDNRWVRLSKSAGDLLPSRDWIDSLALTVSLVVLCSLALPAMLRVRFESRRLHCTENLRQNGVALIGFAVRSYDHRYPAVASSGPEAFSGVYTLRLSTAGLLDSFQQVQCSGRLNISRSDAAQITKLPTLHQLRSASENQLAQWQLTIGGDYAYNLGVRNKGGLVAPRNDGRSQYAILSDAPEIEYGMEKLVSHEGRGVNVLYDDGHVSFVSGRMLVPKFQLEDHLFRNRHNAHEAGLDDLDASLAPSFYPPLGR